MYEKNRIEIERSLVGHFIGEIPADFDKPVAYVMQRDGLWERRVNHLGVFCRQLADAHIPGLPIVLTEGYDLKVPRMPTSVLWEAISFFRKVYAISRTESIVRVIYDRRKEAYETECPKQVVGPARVVFDKRPMPGHKILVAEIHSHAGFGASFSGTDDADELGDRFYGVVGKLDRAVPDISFRVSIGGDRVPAPLGSLFALEEDPMFSCAFPREWLDNVYAWPESREMMEQVEMLFDEGDEE